MEVRGDVDVSIIPSCFACGNPGGNTVDEVLNSVREAVVVVEIEYEFTLISPSVQEGVDDGAERLHERVG